MASMIKYPLYYRRFGVRLPSQLANPRVFKIHNLTLPRNSMYHHISDLKTELGPSSDDPIFSNAVRQIFIEHATELTSRQGNPRSAYVQPGPMIQAYRRKYRRIRLMTRMDVADREELNVLVSNYGLLPHMYKYVRSYYTQYYTWYNINATMWNNINATMSKTSRQMFVYMNLPNIIPTLADLRKAEKRQTRETLRPFQTNEAFGLLDFWTWAGKNRTNSLMGRISRENLSRMNIVMRYKDTFCVINLGTIDEWRKGEKGDKGLEPEMYQLRLLKMVTSVAESASVFDDGNQSAEFIEDPEVEEEEESKVDVEKQLQELTEFTEDEKEELEKMNEEVVVLDDDLDDNSQTDYVFDDDGNIVGEDKLDLDKVENITVTERRLESNILARADAMADKGQITAPEYRRLQALATSYEKLKDPYGVQKTLVDAMKILPEDLAVSNNDTMPDMPEVKDKSMLANRLIDTDRNYIKKVLKKDILNSVMAVQHAGIAVTNYEVDRHVDAVSDYEIHTVTLQPAVGRQSTIRFRLPTVNENGQFISNGSRYYLKKQRREVPFVKVNQTRVALTSYYSKLFVEKSDRSTFNYDRWITNQITAAAIDPSNTLVGDAIISNVEQSNAKVPNIYSTISTRLSRFIVYRKTTGDNEDESSLTGSARTAHRVFEFDYANRFKSGLLNPETVARIERKKDLVACGRSGDAHIVVDFNNVFYLWRDGASKVLGRMEDILELPEERAPVPMVEFNLFGKTIPMGVVLSYLLGFNNLLKKLRIAPRRVPNGERLNLSADEFAVRFLDESLVFQKDDPMATLVFGGFNLYHKVIRNFSVWSFDTKDVYLNVLEEYGIGLRYLRELEMMNAMWVDPITESLLKAMGEPVVFVDLLIRAVEVLKTRYVPERVEGVDSTFEGLERAVGYERFAGVVYKALADSIRSYNTKTAVSRSSVTMKPHEVWVNIVQDPAAELVQTINPVHNTKEKEIITFSGAGGRSQRSMTAEHRLYKDSDKGFISEATVDSGQVAIITYMPPNPTITSVRGTVNQITDDKDLEASNVLSTSALISPFATRDDPKRVNFINIQQSHVISADGYQASPVRTGYEQVLAHRVDSEFASVAKNDGIVEKIDETSMVVRYADGTVEAIQIGQVFGVAAGSTYRHEIVTRLKSGEKFRKGAVLSYNKGFFEPSPISKDQVTWMAGVITRTALIETAGTLEDSCYISQGLSKKLGTEVVKEKNVLVRFDQSIRDMVRVGDKVDIDTILCTIEDRVTSDNKLFDDESLSALRMLSAMAPTAKMVGEVKKVEVFYHGDIEDMSDSLAKIAMAADRERRQTLTKLGKTVTTGRVDQSLRINGNGLDVDCMVIKVYIVAKVGTGLGDKAVFGNQMKTTVGRMIQGINKTQSGGYYDAIFGIKSVQDRIVLSPLLQGTTNTLLRVISQNAAKLYFEEK